MAMTNTNRVGVGTTTPSASLHISGSSGSALFKIDSNISSSVLFVSGSGRVGINTSTPVATFDVLNPTASNGTVQIAAFRTTANGGYISMYNYISPFEMVRIESYNDIANGGSLRLYTLNSSTMTEKFRITNDGQTYIGTGGVIPTARLHVRGIGSTSTTTAFRVENANASASLLVTDDGNVSITGSLNVSGSIISTSPITGQSILGTGLIVNNNNGTTSISDFEVRTQLYDAIYVSSSLNSLLLMSNANGKVGFFGATPNTQSLGWNTTNAQVTKSFDADTITLAQLADVVGTLIAEFKAKGLLG